MTLAGEKAKEMGPGEVKKRDARLCIFTRRIIEEVVKIVKYCWSNLTIGRKRYSIHMPTRPMRLQPWMWPEVWWDRPKIFSREWARSCLLSAARDGEVEKLFGFQFDKNPYASTVNGRSAIRQSDWFFLFFQSSGLDLYSLITWHFMAPVEISVQPAIW